MDYTGDEGGFITLGQATSWTSNFRNNNAGAVKAHFFGKNKLQEVLDQESCVGIRIYNAVDSDGHAQLIIVGVDSTRKDLLLSGKILDQSFPCPSNCDNDSALND